MSNPPLSTSDNPFASLPIRPPRTPSPAQHGAGRPMDFGSPMDISSNSSPFRSSQDPMMRLSPTAQGRNLGIHGVAGERELPPLPRLEFDDSMSDDMDGPTSIFPPIPAPRVYLDPFLPPPTYGTTTMYELLMAVLPPGSPYYIERSEGKVVLNSTKVPKVRKLNSKNTLRNIVYAPQMFADVSDEARRMLSTPALTINWANTTHRDWASGVLPYYTGRRRAKRVHSEKDLELSVFTMLFNPVLTIALAVMAGGIPTDLHEPYDSPYLSSAVQDSRKGAVVPDLLMIKSPTVYYLEIIKLRGEVKSRNVIYVRPRKSKSSKPKASHGEAYSESQGDETADDASTNSHGDGGSNSGPSDSTQHRGTLEEGDLEHNKKSEEGEEEEDQDDEEADGKEQAEEEEEEEEANEDDDEDEEVDAEAEAEEQVDDEVDLAVATDIAEEGAEEPQGDDDPNPAGEDIHKPNDLDSVPRHIFTPLQQLTEQFPLGYAMKFKWPTENGSWSKLTKVIMQLWEQLIQDTKSPEVYDFLSSYDTTTFVVRRENTLYISDNYTVKEDMLLYAYCMVAVALGITKEELRLPKAQTSWWPKEIAKTKDLPAGVVRETLPLIYSSTQQDQAV